MNIEAEVRPSLSPREKSSGFVLVASGGQDEVKCVILSVGSEYCLVETGRGGGEWGGAIDKCGADAIKASGGPIGVCPQGYQDFRELCAWG